MLRHPIALRILAPMLFLSACQAPAPVAELAERPRLEPPEKRCPGGVVPDDAQLAARLRISVEWLERMKEVRKLNSAQICGLNEIRLARALERSDPLAPSHGSEALAWRALAERDEFGEIRPDGRTIASAQRRALLRPKRARSGAADRRHCAEPRDGPRARQHRRSHSFDGDPPGQPAEDVGRLCFR